LFLSGLFLFLVARAALSKWTALPLEPKVRVEQSYHKILTLVDLLTVHN
jgi:hypothetical protein